MVYIERHTFKSLEDLSKFLTTTDIELHIGTHEEPITYCKLESRREEYCAPGDKDRWRTCYETVTYGLYLNNSFFPSSDYQTLKKIGFEKFEEFKLRKDTVNKLYEEYSNSCSEYEFWLRASEITKQGIKKNTEAQIRTIFIDLPIYITVIAVACLLFRSIYIIIFTIITALLCIFVAKYCIELELRKLSEKKRLKEELPAKTMAHKLEMKKKEQEYSQELAKFNFLYER